MINIWREVGAYLRYGDAKCLFFCGVSFSLLFSFLRFVLLDGNLSWEVIDRLLYSGADMLDWVAIISLSISFLFTVFAVKPSLSGRLLRVDVINGISEFFCRHELESGAVIYFRDISRYESSSAYGDALRVSMKREPPLTVAEEHLVKQIWIVSRIANAKFVASDISAAAIVVGVLFAFR